MQSVGRHGDHFGDRVRGGARVLELRVSIEIIKKNTIVFREQNKNEPKSNASRSARPEERKRRQPQQQEEEEEEDDDDEEEERQKTTATTFEMQ